MSLVSELGKLSASTNQPVVNNTIRNGVGRLFMTSVAERTINEAMAESKFLEEQVLKEKQDQNERNKRENDLKS
jgi:hypothetical protein